MSQLPLAHDTAPTVTPAVRPRLSMGWLGGILLILIAVPCFVTLPYTLAHYDAQQYELRRQAPSLAHPMGTDSLGRPLLSRVLLGGAISLGVGLSAASIAVAIGVTWGAVAGYLGGRVDATMMRIVDVLYSLPDILLVVVINLALQPWITGSLAALLGPDRAVAVGPVITLLLAIGLVSWLTMARVIRGQVLSLRAQPFIEAARAAGTGPARVLRVHLLPNLVAPIIVYTTLTVPLAILQESLLSFLGIGIRPPTPSWGNLAVEGLTALHALAQGAGQVAWWLLLFPCLALGLTLMALNFLGDALRARLDPRTAK